MKKIVRLVCGLVLCSLFITPDVFSQPEKNLQTKQRPYDSATIIVRFKEGISPDEIKQFITEHNCRLQGPLPIDEKRTFYTLILPENTTYDDVYKEFSQDNRVKYVMPNIFMEHSGSLGTDFINEIRARNEEPFCAIGLCGGDSPNALEIIKGEGKVIVAVIDTGISPELQSILEELNMLIPGINITNGSNDLSDSVGHGTKMASLLTTVFPNIQVLFIKTEKTNISAAIDGIEYALRVAREQQAKLVINLSFGASRAEWVSAYGSEAATDAALAQFEADFSRFTQEMEEIRSKFPVVKM
jgi:hypothetical protein